MRLSPVAWGAYHAENARLDEVQLASQNFMKCSKAHQSHSCTPISYSGFANIVQDGGYDVPEGSQSSERGSCMVKRWVANR